MRIRVYCDNSNLRGGAATEGASLHYPTLFEYLARRVPGEYLGFLVVASYDPRSGARASRSIHNFFSKLRSREPRLDTIILKRRLTRAGGVGPSSIEKGVDMSLAVRMIMDAHSDRFDLAILATGDADFRPAVEAVLTLGKEVVIAGYDSTMGRNLIVPGAQWVSLSETIDQRVQGSGRRCRGT